MRYARTMDYYTATELLNDDDTVNTEEVLITCPRDEEHWFIVQPIWWTMRVRSDGKLSITASCPYCYRTHLKPDPPENLQETVDKLLAGD